MKRVRVMPSGLVFVDDFPGHAYFHPNFPGKVAHGRVSTEPTKGHGHLWAGDATYYYYTSAEAHTKLVKNLQQAKDAEAQKENKEKEGKEKRLREVLLSVAPDASDLLRQLEDALPKDSMVDSHLFGDGDEQYPILSVVVRKTEGFSPFLEILRRGLENPETE
ncbi:hypothetical protein [Streptomyces tubercidicus]|uniref:hypothetical protein n=1 Tax=Streptomyces tubercidicus TaxID=47759 RepID=UPI00367CE114